MSGTLGMAGFVFEVQKLDLKFLGLVFHPQQIEHWKEEKSKKKTLVENANQWNCSTLANLCML